MKYKLILSSLLILILIACIKQESQYSLQNNDMKWIEFKWDSDSLSGKFFDKMSIMIPVKIDSIPDQFYMQFDLGADVNILYGNPLINIINEFPYLSSKIQKDSINLGDNFWLKEINLKLGDQNSQINDYVVLKDYGSEKSFANLETIGTIGANEMKNKILMIDFPEQKIAILDSIPYDLRDIFQIENCKLNRNRVIFDCLINSENYRFMFDTGSSITPVVTNKEIYEKLTGKQKLKPDTLTGYSWGRKLIIPGALNNFEIHYGENVILKRNMVYYTDDEKSLDFFKTENIDGLIGNSYFFNSVILIDFKEGKFGIRK